MPHHWTVHEEPGAIPDRGLDRPPRADLVRYHVRLIAPIVLSWPPCRMCPMIDQCMVNVYGRYAHCVKCFGKRFDNAYLSRYCVKLVMNKHRIHRVAKLTGLSKDVIRVWERRYGVIQPQR